MGAIGCSNAGVGYTSCIDPVVQHHIVLREADDVSWPSWIGKVICAQRSGVLRQFGDGLALVK